MILIALMCTSLYGGFRRLRVVGARHLVFFNLRDSPAIGFIEAVRAIVVTDVVPSSTSFTRSVLPAVGRSGAHSLNVFNFRASFATETAIGLPGFYQFGDYRVVFWQPGMGSVDTATRLRTDILYLGGNPNVNLSEVLRLFDLKLLVIGSDNTTFRLNRWIEQAKESGVKYYSLRKNYALVLPGK